MNLFETTRQALMTVLRADRVEVDPPPRTLAKHAVKRHVDRVELRAEGVPIDDDGGKIEVLHVVAHDVRLRLSWRKPTVSIGEARFTAQLSERQLTALIPLPPGVDRLTITEDGVTLHTIAGLPIATVVRMEGPHKVHVAPTAPPKVPLLDRFGIDIALPKLTPSPLLDQLVRVGRTFELPELPAGALVEEIEPLDGAMRFSGTVDLLPV
ncbi:LmeA family phospholipid-binding protein [Thermocrispum municipale]|uniref:LmeA family phospholipid-binding protein n=1 Tax=Thermocrispum municipale TaxID=37926 RepID=UPI0004265AA1|nr:LmeA family phospholipid-binding protein [Thermocrispum municipale]